MVLLPRFPRHIQPDIPPGQTPLPRQPLRETVCILLECFLVSFVFTCVTVLGHPPLSRLVAWRRLSSPTGLGYRCYASTYPFKRIANGGPQGSHLNPPSNGALPSISYKLIKNITSLLFLSAELGRHPRVRRRTHRHLS